MRLFAINGTILVLALAMLQQVAQAGPQALQSAYLIRGKLVKDIPAAVAQLRRFLPLRQAKAERCQRLAVLLRSVNGNDMDNFQIASIGMTRPDQIRSKFNAIDVDGLRNLYINAISSYLQKQRVDAGLVELVDCLSNRFRSSDAKARSFLNDAQLKAIVEQYKLISSQPLSVLIDPGNARLPEELNLGDLNPLIRKYLLDLFEGDQAKVDGLFTKKGDEEEGERAVESSVPDAAPAESVSAVGEATDAPFPSEDLVDAEQTQPPAVADVVKLDEDARRYLALLFDSISKVYNTLPLSAKLGDRCQAYSFVVNAEEEHLNQELFIKGLVDQADARIKKEGANDKVSLASENDRENFLFAVSYAPQFLLDADPEALFDLQECVERLTEDAPSETTTGAPEQNQ